MKYYTSLLLGAVALIGSATLFADGDLSADPPKGKHSHGHAHGSSDTPMKMPGGKGHHESGTSGGHDMDAHWTAPAGAADRSNPVAADAASIKRGSGLYTSNCASCHGETGRGDGPAAVALTPKPPDLVVMAPMHPDGDLYWKIENGRGMMPPWKAILSETQMWDLVNYLKSWKTAGKTHAAPGHAHGHQHGH